MNDVTCLVEDRATGEDHHGRGEPQSEAQSVDEERGRNEAHRNESTDFKKSSQEGEIFLRGEGDKGDSNNEATCDDAGFGDERSGTAGHIDSDQKKREENDRLGHDIKPKSHVLSGSACSGGRPFVGDHGSNHEGSENDEPAEGALTQKGEDLIFNTRDLEEHRFKNDESGNRSGKVAVGATNKGGAGIFWRQCDAVWASVDILDVHNIIFCGKIEAK